MLFFLSIEHKIAIMDTIDNQFNLKTMTGYYSTTETELRLCKSQLSAFERALKDADMREKESIGYATDIAYRVGSLESLNAIVISNNNKLESRIEALEQAAHAAQLQVHTMNLHIEHLGRNNTILKQRIEVLEKAVNPMPDYDYEMYANHIAPFKDELIIAGRMMSKMYLGRSRLPVATIVSKQ